MVHFFKSVYGSKMSHDIRRLISFSRRSGGDGKDMRLFTTEWAYYSYQSEQFVKGQSWGVQDKWNGNSYGFKIARRWPMIFFSYY